MKKLIGIFLCVVFINSSDAQTRNTPKDTEIINILDKHFSKLGSLALVNNSIQESNAKRKFFIQDNNLIIFYNDPNDVLTGKPVYDTTSLALNELGKILLTKGKGANGENGIGIEWVPKKNKLKTADESNASTSKIDQKQLAATSGTVVQKMQGQAAGVYVGNDNSPGGVPKVRIRGISSVNSNSNPLYIVDDVPINNINSINPDDIASVEVLKDASSTAMYGVRGANGVIIIKTKKGGYDDALPQEIKIQKELPYTLWIFGERASNFKNSPDSKRLLELLKEKIQDK
jgi:TonB-dependent SusC/RagA subfamily outer membrane receptor